MKRFLKLSVLVALIVVVAAFMFSACNANETEVGVNLIKNGSFENFTTSSKSGTIDNWTIGALTGSDYHAKQNGLTDQDKKDIDNGGDKYLILLNSDASTSYMYQSVKVDRHATYKISYYTKIKTSFKSGSGPNISFLENTSYSLGLVSTVGEWVKKEIYVIPEDTDYLTVCLMAGTKEKPSTGEVYFDNVEMERVDKMPVGVSAEKIYKKIIARLRTNTSGTAFVVCLSLLSVAIAGVAYILLKRMYSSKMVFDNFGGHSNSCPIKNKKTSNKKDKNIEKSSKLKLDAKGILTHPLAIAFYIGLSAFVIRLIITLTMFGFGTDTKIMAIQSGNLFTNGVKNAYSNLPSNLNLFAPGSIYTMYLIGWIAQWGNGISLTGVSILIRMVSVLADLAIVMMIYFFGKKYVGNKVSTVYAAMYAILPIFFVLSGIRGRFDTVLIALVLAAFILAIEKKHLLSYLFMTLAVLLDIRAMAVAPLLLAYFCYLYYKEDITMKSFGVVRAKIVFGFILSFIAFYCLSLPVSISYVQANKAFFIFEQYKNMIAMNYAFVENGFNLYGMVGMNYKKVNNIASIMNLIFLLLFVVYGIALYFKNRNKMELLLIASFTFAIIGVFTLKVTETYLLLSLALMLIYIMISGEKRMFGVFTAYSFLGFLNLGQLMNQSGFLSENVAKSGILNYESLGVFYIFFCVITVLVTLYYAYVTYSICNNEKRNYILPMQDKLPLAMKNWMQKEKKIFNIRKSNIKKK